MATINPYLNFPGTSEEAFEFYRSIFGGDFAILQRFKDTPESSRVPENEKDKLMHISFPIGGNTLMATDAMESMGHHVTYGNNFHLSVDAASKEEADKIFKALSEGARVTMPMDKMFWGAWFGMLTDKFGVQWMVNFDENNSK